MRIQTLVTLAAGTVCAIVVGVGTAGVVIRANASTVVHTAAFDSNCPAKDIRVVKRHEGLGAGWYHLNVCGATTRYMRTGTAFHRLGQHPDSVTPAVPASADPQASEQAVLPRL
ncbi:hypothetical protein [Longimicrobium sp.]|uniref:hypothetical protein n=1 Tax=Longimicrobium sp. TaxID=2029185 RepID=UPI003B3B25DB